MADLVVLTGDLDDILPSTSLLDGKNGTNRAKGGVSQLAANNDIDAIRTWLSEHSESIHTIRSYQKEAARLLAWATRIAGKPISSLTREDMKDYENFLANPPAEWFDPSLPRRGAGRRLFDGPLSEKSINHSIGILSSMFAYLVAGGYLAGNPLALRKQKSRSKEDSMIERYLDKELWQCTLDFIDTLPQGTQSEKQHYERVRWLFRFLYGAALRASEMASAKTSDLFQRNGKWWLHVVGKGKREGDVPISEELMKDFARYRQFYGMKPTPLPFEDAPLLMSITGSTDRSLTPTAVYLIVKTVFGMMAESVKETHPEWVETLQEASTHWLRHTAATHQANDGTDLRFVQKNLRHASIETTSIYLHTEDDLRHEKTTRK